MAVKVNNIGRAAWGKTYRALSDALLDCGEQLTKQGETIMTRGCEKWLETTDAEWPGHTEVTRIGWGKNNVKKRIFGGNAEHPWFTGNLHDSVAVRIASRNRTVAIRYMSDYASKSATRPQTYKGQEIYGSDWARVVAQRGQYVFLPGTNAQMFIGVPYADTVNESSHPGFMEDLQNYFVSFLEDYFALNNDRFKNLIVRPRK